jgi:hypothetical protein
LYGRSSEFQRIPPATLKDAGPAPQEEYAALGHYISNYRDTAQAESVHEEEKEKKGGWFSKKSKDSGGLGFETPAEWLTTPMDRGLPSTEIESRRKKAGWNELTTEKENLFIKFLMFFTGPILYGKSLHLFSCCCCTLYFGIEPIELFPRSSQSHPPILHTTIPPRSSPISLPNQHLRAFCALSA